MHSHDRSVKMDSARFSRLRSLTGRSQKDMAALLGVSPKAVESYEQGWRHIPPTTERMLYYIAFMLRAKRLAEQPPCWEARRCPEAEKAGCAAWQSGEGRFCWFLTGRLCAAARESGRPDEYCYECPVFAGLLRAAGLEEAGQCP
jgi:DNA-binding XRE family transcriptional regulator